MKFLYMAISILIILTVPFVYYKLVSYTIRPSKEEEDQFERFKDEYSKLSDSDKEKIAKVLAQNE